MNFKELVDSTKSVLPTAIGNSQQYMKIERCEPSYEPGTKLKKFFMTIRSSKGNSAYNLILVFKDQVPKEGETDVIPNLRTADMMVRCGCASYRFWGGLANAKHKVQFGPNFPKYKKKTNRPPINPQNKPFICKHIITAVQYLLASGLVTEGVY